MKHIHFIGICGVAMSALALAFKRQGWRVTGSDAGFYPPVSTELKKNGVDFYPGWHPEKMGRPDLVVVGNVAGSHNPEWLYVQSEKLNYKSYPEVIREFFVKENSIVAAGTYGKSTATALLAWILTQAGGEPSYMFGGLSLNDLPAAQLGAGQWSVVEGDEYKSSRWDNGPKFAYYQPTHLLLTSVVWDHADVYPTDQSYVEAFQQLVDAVPPTGLMVVAENAWPRLKFNTKNQARLITYGRGETNTYRYARASYSTTGVSFDILKGPEVYHVACPVLGEYMADKITGCFALGDAIGIKPAAIISAISTFKGMKRRLEKRFENEVTVFDDIARSPVKAQGVLESLRKIYAKKIIAVFEPNTGNRRPQARTWYDGAFAAADEVVIPHLTKIKKEPGHETEYLEGDQLTELIARTQPHVRYIPDDEQAVAYLKQIAAPGDVIVFLGSHGWRGMIEKLVEQMKD